MDLRISPDLALPVSAVTATFVIVGIRGSGKTNTVSVLLEEVATVARFVAIDPTGAMHGLRSSADGKGPGLPVVILGGRFGDAPLDEAAGELIANLARTSPYSFVLDLSLLRKGQQIRFVADFLEALYHHPSTEPLFVAVDEVQRFAPQVIRDKGGHLPRCIGALEDVIKLGRNKGLGGGVASQRLSSINTDIREQAQTLIAHNTVGVRDRKAVREWFEAVGDPPNEAEALAAMPKLRVGEAYVASPGYLRFFGPVQIRPRRTFDSSKTPEVGQRRVEPVGRAAIDLDELRERLGALIEKAKADDPKALRARIAELEKQLRARMAEARVEKVVERVEIEVAVVPPKVREGIKELYVGLGEAASALHQFGATLDDLARRSTVLWEAAQAVGIARSRVAAAVPSANPSTGANERPSSTNGAPGAPSTPTKGQSIPTRGGFKPTAPQQRILDALASFAALGLRDVARSNVAVFANASSTSGTFANNLGALRTAGLIDYPAQGRVTLTEAGRALATPSTPIRSRSDLHEAWYAKISRPQARILRTLVEAYPAPIERGALAELTEASATSGTYANNLGALRSLGVIDYPAKGLVVATALLFPAGMPA